jgi:hypothetical protein
MVPMSNPDGTIPFYLFLHDFISFLLKQSNPISFYLFIPDFISFLLNRYLGTIGLIT